MDGGAISFVHLVKLVDATDTFISQDQGTALQHLCRHRCVFALIELYQQRMQCTGSCHENMSGTDTPVCQVSQACHGCCCCDIATSIQCVCRGWCKIHCRMIVTISEVTGSLCTAAVRPTPEDPLPVVYTALGEMCAMYLISCDFATPGSPA